MHRCDSDLLTAIVGLYVALRHINTIRYMTMVVVMIAISVIPIQCARYEDTLDDQNGKCGSNFSDVHVGKFGHFHS